MGQIELRKPLLKQVITPIGQGRDLLSLCQLPGLVFLWPLQEVAGGFAVDYSGCARHGTFNGLTLAQQGPNTKIPFVVSLNGSSDYTAAPAGCSVRGLGAWTFMAITEVINTAGAQRIWWESVNDVAGTGRFGVVLLSTEKLSVAARSAKAAQANSSKTTDFVLPNGFCMIHVTINIANNSIVIYRNGEVMSATGTVAFGGDTVVEDTAPNTGPWMGKDNAGDWMAGDLAFAAMWSRVLTTSEIVNQVRAGGFA